MPRPLEGELLRLAVNQHSINFALMMVVLDLAGRIPAGAGRVELEKRVDELTKEMSAQTAEIRRVLNERN